MSRSRRGIRAATLHDLAADAERHLSFRSKKDTASLLSVLDEVDAKAQTLHRVRRQCMTIIESLVGRGGAEAFLRSRQPDLGDQTGRELLERNPEDLLKRLRRLEEGGEG